MYVLAIVLPKPLHEQFFDVYVYVGMNSRLCEYDAALYNPYSQSSDYSKDTNHSIYICFSKSVL